MNCEKTLIDLGGIDFPYSAERDKCPVDYSLLLLRQMKVNLCGKGVYCRDGVAQLEKILSDIIVGEGKSGDIELIREICSAITLIADCDLSKSAARQMLDLVAENHEAWEAHITRHRCPSLICGKLTLFYIDPVSCNGCGKCLGACDQAAIDGAPDMIHIISKQLCVGCNKCALICPTGAVCRADIAGVPPKTPSEPVPVGSFKAITPGSGLRKGLRK